MCAPYYWRLWSDCTSATSLHNPRTPGSTTGGGTKPIATANLQLELREFDPRNLPEWAQEFAEFLLLAGQQNADVKTKCMLIKNRARKSSYNAKSKWLSRKVVTGVTS